MRLFTLIKVLATITLLSQAIFASETNDEFFEKKATIGGYGELHLNYSAPEDGEALPPTLDFHRFVLFYGYAWTPEWSLQSEVELEHNFLEGGESTGELALEQAYLNYKANEALQIQVGVVLPSIGLINEHHEPPLFATVERPSYNKNIIPATWFGNGLSAIGSVRGIEYKATLMEGLNTAKVSNKGIRSGRQEGFKSSTETLLGNLRLDYVGVNGLRVGTSYSRNQLMANNSHSQRYNSINISEAHAKYKGNNIYAATEIGSLNYDALNEKTDSLKASFGYYAEAGYNVASFMSETAELYPFIHYTQYNPAFSVKNGSSVEDASQVTYWAIGLQFNPISQVTFKIDYGIETKASDVKTTKINAGAGYFF